MKDILNKRVKFRQAFRPFAPIVPYERAKDIFVGEDESPFMLRAKQVRPEWKDRIPAIVHVDGTARVQTVRREDNERIYDLLVEFEKLTGVPVDPTRLNDRAAEMEKVIESMVEGEKSKDEELSYIG